MVVRVFEILPDAYPAETIAGQMIDHQEDPKNKKIKHLYVEKIQGRIVVLHIRSTNTYVLRYRGNQHLTLNGHPVKSDRTYVWALGSVIKNPHFGSIYYTWIAGKFIQATSKSNFVFKAENIEFSYGNSPNGIKRFNLNEESGRLIGIIGGSGSGKSTLLHLLGGLDSRLLAARSVAHYFERPAPDGIGGAD